MKNILEFIENSAARYPDKLAVADENGGLTYSQLESFFEKDRRMGIVGDQGREK